MRVVALVGDLLDRSKIAAAVPDAVFASTPEECADADTVVVELEDLISENAMVDLCFVAVKQ